VKLNNQNKTINNLEGGGQKLLPSDFYIENGIYVFTKEFHLRRYTLVVVMDVDIALTNQFTKKGIQLYL
jgi:hypothetical protein